MMKKLIGFWSMLVLFLVVGLWVYAAEPESASGNEKDVSAQTAADLVKAGQKTAATESSLREKSPAGRIRRGASASPENAFEARISSRIKVHLELIGELTEIKKIAEEEGAEKTTKAIQDLIDKRNQEHQKSMQELQERRIQMKKRIEERMKARREQAEGQAIESIRQKRAEQETTAEQAEESKSGMLWTRDDRKAGCPAFFLKNKDKKITLYPVLGRYCSWLIFSMSLRGLFETRLGKGGLQATA